jgi:hypothetical protein
MTIFRFVPFKFPGHNYSGVLYDKTFDPACFDHEILYYLFYVIFLVRKRRLNEIYC